MATVIDITSKIKTEEKQIKLGNKLYTVDDSKNTMMEIMALMNMEDDLDQFTLMEKALDLLLGKKARKEIDAMKLNAAGYKVVFDAVIALTGDMTYEEAVERFQNEQ